MTWLSPQPCPSLGLEAWYRSEASMHTGLLQPQEMASFCPSCFQPWLAPQQPVNSRGLLTASLPVQVCFEFTAHLQIKAGREVQGLRAQRAPPHPEARHPLSWRQGVPFRCFRSKGLGPGSGFPLSIMEPEVGRWGRPTTGINPSSGA